ncbi:uncharacterized protein [Littorina saxatilis]|uniref:uncharacterized protein isoform X1 n=1 Tax=Littorina saxatilis TaxID=31220 RepID=UPI0038B51DDB
MELTSDTVALSLSIFIGGFLCTQYLSHVLTLDSLLIFVGSLWIMSFPRDSLALVVPDKPIDALHEYLAVMVLTPVMVPALVWFLSTDPTDVTIRTALAVCRLVGFCLTATFTFMEQRFSEMFSALVGRRLNPSRDEWVFQNRESTAGISGMKFQNSTGYACIFYPMAMLVVVYMVHLFYNSRINAQTRYGNLNGHLQLDLMLGTIYGLACIFAPGKLSGLFGQNVDWLHVYLYRQIGFQTLGMVCLNWIAPRFRSVANKRAVLFSRALTMLVSLLITVGRYRRGDIPAGMGSKIMMLLMVARTLPAALGSLRYDQGPGWDVPWRGLRVPDVQVGLGSPADFYHVPKASVKKRKGRNRSRGRRR